MKKHMISRLVVIAVVVIALGGLVALRKGQAKQAEAYGERPVAVQVAQVTRQPMESTQTYLGVVEARQTARIASRISAKVTDVAVDEGAVVKAGDLLLQLDDSDIQAQVKALEASIESLENNRDYWVAEDQRDSKLAQEGVISTVEAETTRNRKSEAVAKLESAQRNRENLLNQLTYTRLTSPFDGVVTLRDVDPGDLASPGRTLLVLEEQTNLNVAFDVPQADMEVLSTGIPVRIQVPGQELTATLTHLYPSLDRSRMVRAEVALPPDAGLQLGAYVPLSVVLTRHDDAVTIPREALMRNTSGATAVFVVKDGVLAARPVSVLMENSGLVEVAGVEPGEDVVTSTFLGWATLASGIKVEVIR